MGTEDSFLLHHLDELYLFCLKKKEEKSEPSLSRCKLVALVLYWSPAYLV